jgi:LAO/AO transport system kinase
VGRLLEGSEIALAKLISLVENNPAGMTSVMPMIQHRLGKAFCIGLTGPPGAGKSSLASQIIKVLRSAGAKVGIIAVDPTSPFTGGALLGDRVRMQEHYLDPGVFIRSMATRGSLGGLARATKDVIKLMDVFGFDYILVETVGVGQTELDIMQATDITVVVLVPEGGDSIQAMKAGLMEIGDIFTINKSDRPGADSMAVQLQGVLQMNPRYASAIPPVLLTRGTDGKGVAELVESVRARQTILGDSDLEARRREKRNLEFEEILKETVVQEWQALAGSDEKLQERLSEVVEGSKDPYTMLREIFPDGCLRPLTG